METKVAVLPGTPEDVAHKLRASGTLMPIPQAAFIASKICDALDFAHRKKDPTGQPMNIIHRDVSPQNVLVGYEGEVKVIDFGIAKAANRASKTQAGVLKGKFGYMSPEQVRGLPIDRRSDIFAVGVLLYEMLTGERLFIGESDFSTLEKVRNADVVAPTAYNKKITKDLEAIVMKALAREVEDRYQWASDLAEDLLDQRLLAADAGKLRLEAPGDERHQRDGADEVGSHPVLRAGPAGGGIGRAAEGHDADDREHADHRPGEGRALERLGPVDGARGEGVHRG